jgi:hypothetical protein
MLIAIMFMQVLIFVALVLVWYSQQRYIDHTHKLSTIVNRLHALSNSLRGSYIGKCSIPGYFAKEFEDYLERKDG